jgi:hypothetical protein
MAADLVPKNFSKAFARDGDGIERYGISNMSSS